MRIITSIEAGNLDNARKMVATHEFRIRHIQGVRQSSLVTRAEFLTTTRSPEDGLPTEVIWSNGPGLIGQMHSVFETLWESAVPAQNQDRRTGKRTTGRPDQLTFDADEVVVWAKNSPAR